MSRFNETGGGGRKDEFPKSFRFPKPLGQIPFLDPKGNTPVAEVFKRGQLPKWMEPRSPQLLGVQARQLFPSGSNSGKNIERKQEPDALSQMRRANNDTPSGEDNPPSRRRRRRKEENRESKEVENHPSKPEISWSDAPVINRVNKEELQYLVNEGYVKASPHPDADAHITFYTQERTKRASRFRKVAPPLFHACRGLIVDDETGQIVARTFSEAMKTLHEEDDIPSGRLIVTKEYKSNIGIMYGRNNEYALAMNGEFRDESGMFEKTKEQVANYAESYDFNPAITYLWDISSRESGEETHPTITLVGRVETATGRELALPDPSEVPFPVVEQYFEIQTKEQLERAVRTSQEEGFIFRVEETGKRYLAPTESRLWSEACRQEEVQERVLKLMSQGVTKNEIIARAPEDIQEEVEGISDDLSYRYSRLERRIRMDSRVYPEVAALMNGGEPYAIHIWNRLRKAISNEKTEKALQGQNVEQRDMPRTIRGDEEVIIPFENGIAEVRKLDNLVTRRLVKKTPDPDPESSLAIYDYVKWSQKKRGTADERANVEACRGLMVDTRTSEIAARPFSAIQDLDPRDELPAGGFTASEKLDGTLMVMYWKDGKPHLATRRAFTDNYGRIDRATELLNDYTHQYGFDHTKTHLFESIDPKDPHMVDYGQERTLTLLAIIDTATGRELPLPDPSEVPFPVVQTYPEIQTTEQLREAVERSDREGYVIRMNQTGMRYRIKTPLYKKREQWRSEVRRIGMAEPVWRHFLHGGTREDLLAMVPARERTAVARIAESLEEQYSRLEEEAKAGNVPKISPLIQDKLPYRRQLWEEIKPKDQGE